jgi:hypothetical protein
MPGFAQIAITLHCWSVKYSSGRRVNKKVRISGRFHPRKNKDSIFCRATINQTSFCLPKRMTKSYHLLVRGRKPAFSRTNKILTSSTCRNRQGILLGIEVHIMLLQQTQATVENSREWIFKQLTLSVVAHLNHSWATPKVRERWIVV